MMRKLFPIILIFLLFFCNFEAVCQENDINERLSIKHGPYLIDPGENSITVVWLTNKNCVSWIEYCGETNFGTFPTWGGYPAIARSSHHGLIDANTTLHTIRIINLKPGTKYRYRIISKEILQFRPYEVLFGDTVVSDVYQLETLSPNKTIFSFAVTTDVHEQTAVLDTLLQHIALDSLEMMFFTGDILSWLDSEEQIFNGFLDVVVNRFAKEKPIIYLRGNHETRGHFARNLVNYFPHSSGKFYYSFNHGNVHFIILDSGEDKPDSHPVYAGLVDFDNYRNEQAEWLKQDIQSESFKKAEYKIVFSHLQLFTGSDRHGVKYVTEKWGLILNEAEIDLVFSGHTHRYSYMKPTEEANRFPIIIIGKDMFAKTDVLTNYLPITIKDRKGDVVEKIQIPAKIN